jgi:hypothetical protein
LEPFVRILLDDLNRIAQFNVGTGNEIACSRVMQVKEIDWG